jgi:hypothetical protein
MKYIITENQMINLQCEYLDYLFKDLHKVDMRSSDNTIFSGPNAIFWKQDKNIILSLRIRESNKLEVEYLTWKHIEDMFSLGYYETQDLIEEWAKKHLGLEKVRAAQVDFF